MVPERSLAYRSAAAMRDFQVGGVMACAGTATHTARKTRSPAATRLASVNVERGDDRLRDHAQRAARRLARTPKTDECVVLRQALTLHQDPLCPLDDLSSRERFGQR